MVVGEVDDGVDVGEEDADEVVDGGEGEGVRYFHGGHVEVG